MRPFAYARARTVDDATDLLRGDATAIAGGTDLLGLMKAGLIEPERLVDLTGVPGLTGWTRERGSIRIGALTSLAELESSDELAGVLPIIRESLHQAATTQLRNMGTVGGNLLQRNRCWYFRDPDVRCWLKGGDRCYAVDGDNRYHAVVGASECNIVAPSDLAPALIACDAEVTLRSAAGEQVIPVADLYVVPKGSDRREHVIRQGEVLTHVRIPAAALKRRGTFIKSMDRRAWSFALVSVAASARVEDGRVRDVRIVLGGVAPVPWRVAAADRSLEGVRLDDATCLAAADEILAGARPLKDNGYKLTLARELVRRALMRIAAPE